MNGTSRSEVPHSRGSARSARPRASVRLPGFGAALMLAVAYAANLGGIGTKIGTAPNAQFAGYMAARGVEVTFLQFSAVGLPFVVLLLPVTWLLLWRVGRSDAPRDELGAEALDAELARLGPMRRPEWLVLGVFVVTAALWIAGQPLTAWLKPHARDLAGITLRTAHVEGGVAMLAAVALLALRGDGRSTLELRSLRRVPWETLLLLGGSFSMAAGIEASGLSRWLADQLASVREVPPAAQVLLASLATVALSSVCSNTATIGVMLGVLGGVVSPSHATPCLFAATIASSCDFALPAGTPPNAIVFGSGYVTIPRMAKTGVVLDVVAAVVAALWCLAVVPLVL